MHATISQLIKNKAPGPNGYVAEFYKLMKKEISTHLEALYSQMMTGDRYFPTENEDHIKVIPMKGRDTEIPSSYRPTSLINIDAKIMTKIIENRLALIIPTIIHPAQSDLSRADRQ